MPTRQLASIANQYPAIVVIMGMNDNLDDFETDEQSQPEESFHIELDLYETGDYSNLLVIPCNDNYIVVSDNEHLCTMVKTCDEPECWEQQEGSLEEDMIEKIGTAISGYISFR